MLNFTEIAPSAIQTDLFTLIGKDWTLITAGDNESFNTMTASWGGFGVLWNKNVATIYVRPQRFTYEFIEQHDLFTLSFFDDSYRPALTYCGRNSGRDVNKMAQTGLSPIGVDGSVGFEQARMIMVCKKLYHSDIDPKNFHDASIESHYNDDYHRMYIAEILKVLVKN